MIKRYFSRTIGRLTGWLLPDKTKRMVVLASLSTNLHPLPDDEKVRNEKLIDLNSYFHLSTNQDAILFAIELSKILWADLQNRLEGLRDDYDKMAKEVVALCPSSLRYDSDERMIKDIASVLRYSDKHMQFA